MDRPGDDLHPHARHPDGGRAIAHQDQGFPDVEACKAVAAWALIAVGEVFGVAFTCISGPSLGALRGTNR